MWRAVSTRRDSTTFWMTIRHWSQACLSTDSSISRSWTRTRVIAIDMYRMRKFKGKLRSTVQLSEALQQRRISTYRNKEPELPLKF